MKQKNNSTNKILISFIFFLLLIVVFFLGKGNYATNISNLFTSKEDLLKQRYTQYSSLIDNKNWADAYNYYSSSIKNEGSLEKFVKSREEAPSVGKQQVTINKVTIEDNIGYVDRNNTICDNSNCDSKKEIRGYKKWVYENENWYYSPPDPLCIRNQMYDMPPEFLRALSLVKQRLEQTLKDSIDLSYFNCVDVEYGDVGNAEGAFNFDKNNSNIEKLSIAVDKSYSESDDLLTAFLLVHETTHAYDYLNNVENGVNETCINEEKRAFYNQILFGAIINQQERESVNARLRSGRGINNQLEILSNLSLLETEAQRFCGTNGVGGDCTTSKALDLIENMLRASPYYQKQCSL